MAIASQTGHHEIKNPGYLPYAPYGNTLGDNPEITEGADLLLGLHGEIRRRPGWATLLGQVTGTVRRIYQWSRWNSANQYNVMLSVEDGADTKVYKYDNSVDTAFVLLWTATNSGEPFDFINANNWCLFSSGTTRENTRKWQSGSTSYLWGIDAPTVAPVATVNSGETAVTVFTAAAGTNWTDPTFALADDSSYAVYNAATQDYLRLTSLGLALPNGAVGVGVQVVIKANGTSATTAQRQIRVGLTKDGTTLVGAEKIITLNQTTDTSQTLGGATDLWGTTLTEAEMEANSFGILIRDADTTAAALNVNYATIQIFYTQATVFSGAYGYKYRMTYGSSAINHQSSPSDTSECTGTFTAGSVTVTLTASTDPQVNRIHLYRTTDAGSDNPLEMLEVSGSPFTNVSQTITDTTDDADLGLFAAPALLRNDPPPAWKGMVSAQGRIWGFINEKVYFTGAEEISAATGIGFECVPGGADGNYQPFDRQVNALAAMDDGIAVATAKPAIWRIQGDTLDTFRYYRVLDLRGPSNRAAVATLGGSVAWLDIADQVWLDGEEIGLPIRPDLQGIDHSQAAMAFHISREFHHLYLMDGSRGRILVYDIDTKRWLPPWRVGSTLTAISSGPTTGGLVEAFIARNGSRVLRMTPSIFTDDGVTYAPYMELGLFRIHKDGSPDWRGTVCHIETQTDATVPSIGVLVDDDPSTQPHISLTAGDPQDRAQGISILCKRFEDDGVASRQGQRVSVRADWPSSSSDFRLYNMDIAYRAVGR